MSRPFVVEGDLWLVCQEGGFVQDGLSLADELTEHGDFLFGVDVANLIVEHFEKMQMGNKHIGMVRITIEGLKRQEED